MADQSDCAPVWDYEHPFTLGVVAQAQDIDGLNHTNNAVYVQWCERIGWAHSESLGLGLQDYQRLNRAMAIRKGEYHYLQATNCSDDLLLATWLFAGASKLSMERRFQLVRRRDGVTVLRGVWELVCIELSTGRACRLPPEFIQAYLGAPPTPLAASGHRHDQNQR